MQSPADKCDFSGSINPQFSLTQGDTPNLSCVVSSGDPSLPTLDFGQTRSVGTITCDSEPADMTCTDTGTFRFFRIDRVLRHRLTRKNLHMNLNRRVSVVAAIAAATFAAVVGCSNAGAPTSSGTTSTEQSASASVQPVASSAMPQAPASPTATAAAGIKATIAAEGDTHVRLGGPPMRFNVTLVNDGPDVAKLGLVVSMGHCSCGPPGASMMAEGTMRMLDPRTSDWVEVPYVRQGTGMDFITANLVPPFPLGHGQTVSYQLEMALRRRADLYRDQR